jgi:ankyrin repeat protein
VLKIEESVQAIKECTTSVHEALGNLTDSFNLKEIDEHLRRIHKWLDAPDPSSNHVVALGKREITTGSWFTDGKAFAAWKDTPNSILWLHSIPGGGKTILSSTIIQACHEHCNSNSKRTRRSRSSPIWAVAYFYFDFADTVKQNYSKMLRSLMKQLSEQLGYTSDSLEKLFNESTSGIGQTPSDDSLLETLGEMVVEFDQVYFIFDALDECAQRFFLLEGILEMHDGWKHEMLHLLVTSRNEHDIAQEFESLISPSEEIHIHKNFIEADIRAYIYARLQSDRRLTRWRKDKQVQLTIATTLTEKADGMFRWAACQLDELKTCFSRRDLHIALESLPKDLDETYAQILVRIDEDRSDVVIKILQWLAYSARPLQIEELADIITVRVDSKPRVDIEARFLEPRDLLTICSSLVTTNLELQKSAVGEMVGEQIKLAHLSVRDYLTSKRILASKASTYSIQEMRAHDLIAQICLAYLLQFGEVEQVTEFEPQTRYPLSKYAAEYWPYHMKASGTESKEAIQLCMELFSNSKAFDAWIDIYDTDMASSEGQMADEKPDLRGSPLYYAAQVGLKEPVRLLLENGSRSSQYGGIYGYALQAASAAGHDASVEILLQGNEGNSGADPDAQGGAANNALNAACQEGHLAVVKSILKLNVNVNITGGNFANPLQAASAGGHHEIVELLLEAGANVNRLGGHYQTALIAASYNGHEKVVATLLDNGADNEITDSSGRTPLSQAASEGRLDNVKLLLRSGADVNHEDNDGWGPLDEASPGGHYDCVVALLDAGAAINAVDKDGNTALHFTAAQPYAEVVRLLAERGANIHLANSQGELVVHTAAWAGRLANLEVLMEFGADINARGNFMW